LLHPPLSEAAPPLFQNEKDGDKGVRERIESYTAFSNPLRVKLARVGLMIPPCGVPVSVGRYFPR